LTDVGLLVVDGPLMSYQFSLLINEATSLVVDGSGVAPENRIKIIESSGNCGDGVSDEDPTKVVGSPGAPILSTISSSLNSTEYSNVRINTLGSYKVCWCHSSACSLNDFLTHIGELTVEGPIPNQTFSLLVNTAGNVSVSGTSLSTQNRILIVANSESCGSSTSLAAIENAPGTPSGSSSELIFSDVSVISQATYKVCFWGGRVGTGVQSDYDTPVGTLVI